MTTIRPFFRRLLWGAVVGLIAGVAYRGIQYGTETRAVMRDDCWTWRWLAFDERWLWPYLSMFVLVGLPWFLLPEWKQVKRFAICLLTVAAVGWISFLFFPTACVRPSADDLSFPYRVLLSVDRPNNCMPCLHSAFSVLAAGMLAFHGILARTPGRLFLVAWVGLTCVSIVVLRQHTDLDTLAGAVLGVIALSIWRWQTRDDEAQVV